MKTTAKREQWAASRGAVMEGLPLKPNREAEKLYRLALQKAVQRMAKDYAEELRRTLRETEGIRTVAMDANLGAQLGFMFSGLDTKWAKFFGRLAKRLVTKMVEGVDKASQRQLNASLKDLSGGLTIKTPKLPEAMVSTIQAATVTNTALIKSIQAQYHEKVMQTVMASAGDAQAIKEAAQPLVNRVYFIGETTEQRAALIARDQVAKLATATNAARMQAAGVKQFKWRHSGGSADPRKLHQEYDGQIFDLDNPPVIDERTGERGLPGQAINCRCFLVPVLDFGG